MEIVIDFDFIYNLASLPPHLMAWSIFWDYYGWLPISISILWGMSQLWLKYIRMKWCKQFRFILLAIDIPRNNSQTPKAVENIFSYLAGAHSSINFIEKWWEGKIQLSFALEIVSIDGYIQFLIHTPEQFRNLVESAIYSQYPDAEITEVNDYTERAPNKYPDEEYDIWGCEYIQKKNFTYPIKTYKEFEHMMGAPETQYKDTMASLMDLGSSLRYGEQLWFQILITPIDFSWADAGDKEISKVIGEKVKSGNNIFDNSLGTLGSWFNSFSDQIFGGETVTEKKQEDQKDTFKMMNLKPKEKKQVEAIQEKTSKLGFEFKIRYIYLAKKELMNKPKVNNGFVGFMKQFAVMDLNNLKPDMKKTATRAVYFFKDYIIKTKKINIMAGYKKRDDTIGRRPGILNIEELATVWHFPVEAAALAPLIQKTPGKKAEAPSILPTELEAGSEELLEPIFTQQEDSNDSREADLLFSDKNKTVEVQPKIEEKAEFLNQEIKEKGEPPNNLPFA